MSGVANFDPANMAIWIDVRAIYNGDYASLKASGRSKDIADCFLTNSRKCIEEWEDFLFESEEWTHQAARLYMALCHEKRHFVDSVFTTHGHWVQRQFQDIHGATGLLFNQELDPSSVENIFFLPIGSGPSPKFKDKEGQVNYDRLVKNRLLAV